MSSFKCSNCTEVRKVQCESMFEHEGNVINNITSDEGYFSDQAGLSVEALDESAEIIRTRVELLVSNMIRIGCDLNTPAIKKKLINEIGSRE